MDSLASPLGFLKDRLRSLPDEPALRAYEAWWMEEGDAISAAVDRAGTPWLRNFDRSGRRVDEILFAPEYARMLAKGYEAGAVWRVFAEKSLQTSFLLGYITCFYNPGLYCPYTVSLATAVPLEKYGDPAIKDRFLPHLLRRDSGVWQGATWMTEIKGGSDLGANVETVATPAGDRWSLTGDKYFASNAGADLAVVAARPEGAAPGLRGVALFLVPRRREDGSLNYTVRRLKDKIATRSVPTGEVELRGSQAWKLGGPELILEVLNLSRTANSVGSVAVIQRALEEARAFAAGRVAFGKPVLEQPLLKKQFEDRLSELHGAFALAWRCVGLLDEVWRERAPYSDRHTLFRLLAHLAKYWTAETAAQTAKWAMEVHGGLGTLGEFPVERWFREAMILAIWEGTAHRQILDGLEVMEKKGAHLLLFKELGRDDLARRVEDHLALPREEREARADDLFRDLARFTAKALGNRH